MSHIIFKSCQAQAARCVTGISVRTLLGQLHCEKGVGEWGEFTGDKRLF